MGMYIYICVSLYVGGKVGKWLGRLMGRKANCKQMNVLGNRWWVGCG